MRSRPGITMASILTVSNRKPIIMMLMFAGFIVFALVLFSSRQEAFLNAITNANKDSLSAQSHGHDHHQHQQEVVNIASKLQSQQQSGVRNHPKKAVFKDEIDDSGATQYLQTYQKQFAPKDWTKGPGSPNDPHTITEWWQAAAMIDWYINTPIRYTCQKHVSYGNWHACQDKRFEVKPPCLVYSFGINFDYSFDDAMGKHGCEVHSFDPSMGVKDHKRNANVTFHNLGLGSINTDAMGVKDHKRNANVTFHNLGLGSINTDAYVARQDMYVKGRSVWRLRTVKAIKEMLGHADRVIDVFKMDVEGYEWNVIDHMMETNMYDYIRQYMLEFHLFPKYPLREDYVNLYNIYRRLRELGMREFFKGPHPKKLTLDTFNNQGDLEFVNVNFGQ